MDDDIVERLREGALSGDLPLGAAFDWAWVADEIERLRAIVAGLAAIDPRAFDGCEEPVCAICWGETLYGDTPVPDGAVVVEHESHGWVKPIAHQPDCLWLAARATLPPEESPC